MNDSLTPTEQAPENGDKVIEEWPVAEAMDATDIELPIPKIEITISEDKIKAFLTIEQSPPEPYQATVDAVGRALRAAKVEYGVLEKKIEQIIAHHRYPKQELIAQLPPPEIKVTLSERKLEAFLTIEQTPSEPYQATVENIHEALHKVKVQYGVLAEKIEEIVANHLYPQEEIIARGRPPQPGKNGRLEYLAAKGAGGSPRDLGYRVDHYNLNLIENVTAGQVLVRRVAAIPGIPGMTVQGREIRVPRVREARLPVGKGTRISDEDPLALVAEIDGFIRLDRRSFNQLVVEQMFDIYGDVDMSTGHLDIEGSVRITNNVKEGFKVVASGSIVVQGCVEGCYLEAGGKVEVKGGIIGGLRRATVKAGGDVVARFADQADVISGGSIYIDDEAVNCNLQAEEVLVVGEGGKNIGNIVGGQATAGREIRLVSVGTNMENRTRLRVGERPVLVARRRNMQTDIRELQRRLKQVKSQIEGLSKKLTSRIPARQNRQVQRAALEERQAVLAQDMQRLMEQARVQGVLLISNEDIEALDAEIKETGELLNKVEVQIGAIFEKREMEGLEADFSPEDADTLAKLKRLRHQLTSKLAEMEKTQTEQKNPWAKLPRILLRNLEASRASLEKARSQLAALETEEAIDQRIEEIIAQLEVERDAVQLTLSGLRDELSLLNKEIAATQQEIPRIIVTGKLWPGTEVVMLGKKHHFTTTEEALRIELSTAREGAIVIRSLHPPNESSVSSA